jgi:small-conductance mechanosensitive channel
MVNIEFGVAYETSSDELRNIPAICEKFIHQMELCTFDSCHFRKLGTYSLIFELVFWVEHKEHSVQLDRTQEFLLNLKKEFETRGVKLAYPTQTIHMKEHA